MYSTNDLQEKFNVSDSGLRRRYRALSPVIDDHIKKVGKALEFNNEAVTMLDQQAQYISAGMSIKAAGEAVINEIKGISKGKDDSAGERRYSAGNENTTEFISVPVADAIASAEALARLTAENELLRKLLDEKDTRISELKALTGPKPSWWQRLFGRGKDQSTGKGEGSQ